MRQDGFTLIEMAIVLVIIGIILSAVTVGKHLQRKAEYQKIHEKFINQWVIAYDLYFAHAGVVLGDSHIEPRFMVAGASVEGTTELPGKICHGQGYNYGIAGEGDRKLAVSSGSGDKLIDMDLFSLMGRNGISLPSGLNKGREDSYLYVDANGDPQAIQVCFQWNPRGHASGSGNVMTLRGLTPDMARDMDYMIDGRADAGDGRFRQQGILSSATSPASAALEWGANSQGGKTPSAVKAGSDRDEGSVALVTAHYKMNE
jgi:prepilin-type N-terminal cleavage/methylation domain-containing protein